MLRQLRAILLLGVCLFLPALVSAQTSGVVRGDVGPIVNTLFRGCTDGQVVAKSASAAPYGIACSSGGGGGVGTATDTQVLFDNAGAVAGSGNLTYAAGLLSSTNGGVTGLVPRDYNEAAIITSDVVDDNVIGAYVLARMASTGATNLFAEGLEADAVVTATTTEGAVGFSTQLSADGAITVGHLWNLYIYAPSITNGATITSEFGIWLDALGGVATNTYSFWSDEQGVFRIKSDNTFDSVYQAIPALYNPQFTKYTPGAANYERIVEQWNGNVGELGIEKGGTGTLRNLRLIGSGLQFGSTLVAPAGSGTRYLCISTAGLVTSSASACSGT